MCSQRVLIGRGLDHIFQREAGTEVRVRKHEERVKVPLEVLHLPKIVEGCLYSVLRVLPAGWCALDGESRKTSAARQKAA